MQLVHQQVCSMIERSVGKNPHVRSCDAVEIFATHARHSSVTALSPVVEALAILRICRTVNPICANFMNASSLPK